MNKHQIRMFIYNSPYEKSAKEIYFDLKEINKNFYIPCYRTIYRWRCRFNEGRKSLVDNPRSGRPLEYLTQSKIRKIKLILKRNPYISFENIVDECKFTYGTVFHIVYKVLKLRKIYSKWLPLALSTKLKFERLKICQRIIFLIEKSSDFDFYFGFKFQILKSVPKKEIFKTLIQKRIIIEEKKIRTF